MIQLQDQIKVNIEFQEIDKTFSVMIPSDYTGLKFIEEMSQLYDSKKYDIEFYNGDQLLDESQPFVNQGVINNGKIKLQYAIPILLLISSNDKKYKLKLASHTKTTDIEKHLITKYDNQNITVSLYKGGEILLTDKSLFDQGIVKNDIINANVKQAGG